MATINEFKQKAETIANATQVGENTAQRVGGALQDAAELIDDINRECGETKKLAEGQKSKIDDLYDHTSDLQGEIASEAGARENADKELEDRIKEETRAREKADEILSELILKGLTARFNGIVQSAEIEQKSVENVSGVYYIASKRIFAGKSGSKYVNNWTGADMYLNEDRTAIRKDKVYLLGADVYAWNKNVGTLENITVTLQKSLAEESKTRKKEFDDLNSLIARGLTVRFNGFLDDAEISHISTSNVDGVYYISSKKMFAGKSGNRYVNNWTGADMYLNDDRSAICKDKVYLLGADVYAWNKNADTLESITVTLQKSLAEESKTRKKEFDHLDDKIDDLDKDFNDSLNNFKVASVQAITASFDGFVDNVNIISSTTATIKGIYYDRIRKSFVAKTKNGEYITGSSHEGTNWMDSYFNPDASEILKSKIYKCKDKLYCWDEAANNLVQMGNDGGLKIVMHNADENTFVLTPNTLHVWPEMEQLHLTFAAAEDGYVGEYGFQFTCPEDKATNLMLPTGLEWPDKKEVFPKAGMTYRAVIFNNSIIML